MATLSKTLKKNKQPKDASAKSLQASLYSDEDEIVSDYSKDTPTSDADYTLDDMAEFIPTDKLFSKNEDVDNTSEDIKDTGLDEPVEPSGPQTDTDTDDTADKPKKEPSKMSDREKAYELFEKAKERNEWLDLVQVLAKAFTKYGAAKAGKSKGIDMTGLNIPGVDYGKRTEAEERMLERRLRDIREEEASQAKGAAAIQAAKDRELKAALDERRIAAYEKSIGQKGATMDPIALAEARAQIQQKNQIEAEKRQADKLKERATDTQLQNQLNATKGLIATQTLISQGAITDPETIRAANKALIDYAAESGLPISDIYKVKKRFLLPDKLDVDAIVKRLIEERTALETKIQDRQQKGGTAPAADTTTSPETAGQAGSKSDTMTTEKPATVKIMDPTTKEIVEVLESKKQKYLDKGGVLVK